jgi:amino acid transporter
LTADQTHSEQVARDDAHLESLGIKPQLNRTLGAFSSFAVAFSYISVATGSFTQQAVAIGVGGPPFIWGWFIVILGQTFVALNFAELSSHFPVAGSIYQWSKRLSNKTLGWFTGWFYFWAGTLTVTAVAATVPYVMSPLFGIDLAAPSPVPFLNTWSFLSIIALGVSTLINAFGVRLLAILNNLGVAAEIIGMIVLALVLLIFANNQPIDVIFDTSYTADLANGNYFAVFLVGMFLALFVVYGFDTAGTFGEETVDAGRQAPRGILAAIWLSGLAGFIFLLAVTLSFKDIGAAVAEGQAFGFPFATTIQENLNQVLFGEITLGDLYLVVILIAVSVCTLAIQGATTRLMFSMGRDGRLPLGSTWGHVNGTFKTPTNAAVGVGILALLPLLVTGAAAAFYLAIAATGTIYISYLLCNWGVLRARRRGWPHQGAWFKLGSWGTVINILALIYGLLMVINIGLWEWEGFGDFGNELRSIWSNPPINTFLQWNGEVLTDLPAIPVFEFYIGAVLIVGVLYYLVSGQRGKEDVVQVEADTATGETMIA